MEKEDRLSTAEHLIRHSEFDEAIAMLTDILADEPDNLQALLNIGIAYTESGRNDAAVQTLAFYVARNDENDEAWEALGCARLRMKEYAEAERCLEKAHELNPSNSSVLRNLSVLYSQTGRGRSSLQYLEKSYELNPNDYLTTFALATAYRFMGRAVEARSLFEGLRAFEHLPDPVRDEAEKHLLELSVGWS